jgi:hypothetical protein
MIVIDFPGKSVGEVAFALEGFAARRTREIVLPLEEVAFLFSVFGS